MHHLGNTMCSSMCSNPEIKDYCVGSFSIDNPAIKADIQTISFAEASCPSKVAGELPIKLKVDVPQKTSNIKAFVQFWQDDILYAVQETVISIDGDNLELAVAIPEDLKAGEYFIKVGLYNYLIDGKATYPVGKTLIDGMDDSERKPRSNGVFVDKTGAHNVWYVDDNYTLIWNGEPYICFSNYLFSNENNYKNLDP